MATLDTRIPLAVQAPQINTPNQNRLQSLAIQGQQMQLDEARRGIQNRNGLQEYMAQPGFYTESGGINPAMIPGVAQFDPEMSLKLSSEAANRRDKDASSWMKGYEWVMQGLDTADTPEKAVAYVRNAVANGVLPEASAGEILGKIPSDPAQYSAWRQQQREATLSEYQRRSLGLQQRGQDLANARAREQMSAPAGAPFEAMMDGQPVLVQRYNDGSLRQVEGLQPKAPKRGNAQLPASALKMQQDALESIGLASTIASDLGGIISMIDSGAVDFGPGSNLVNQVRNFSGLSNKESRNFASVRGTLEKMRNDSLRLNKGVQTEGDAVRAWNEMFQNLNDKDVVRQRLQEIQQINNRAAALKQVEIDSIRSNYNLDPLDTSSLTNVSSVLGGSEATPATQQPASQVGSDTIQTVSDAASYQALPSGAQYRDPTGQIRTKR